VLIIGGGDGGVAREVVKHPLVEEVYQVEIDSRVVEVSRKYLQFMAQGFDSEKVRLLIGDGFEFMKNHREEFDVIITDSSDPIGPAASLFEESYFGLMRNALKPGGIVCSQGSSFWIDSSHVAHTMDACRRHFVNTSYATVSSIDSPLSQLIHVSISTCRQWFRLTRAARLASSSAASTQTSN